MNLTEIFLIILGIQVSNIFMLLCYSILGNKKIKTINPVKAYQEHKKEEEKAKEQELKELQILQSLENIDKYDGTGIGQRDITTSL